MLKSRLILTATALGLTLLLTPVLSAAAVAHGNQPANWVSWEGNVTPKLYEANMGGTGHIYGNVLVKKLSDGAVVGHINAQNLATHTRSYCVEFISADFSADTAIIEGWFSEPGFENPIRERYTLVDGGEPGVGVDRINIELEIAPGLWVSFFGSPVPVPLVTHGNIQVHSSE